MATAKGTAAAGATTAATTAATAMTDEAGWAAAARAEEAKAAVARAVDAEDAAEAKAGREAAADTAHKRLGKYFGRLLHCTSVVSAGHTPLRSRWPSSMHPDKGHLGDSVHHNTMRSKHNAIHSRSSWRRRCRCRWRSRRSDLDSCG